MDTKFKILFRLLFMHNTLLFIKNDFSEKLKNDK